MKEMKYFMLAGLMLTAIISASEQQTPTEQDFEAQEQKINQQISQSRQEYDKTDAKLNNFLHEGNGLQRFKRLWLNSDRDKRDHLIEELVNNVVNERELNIELDQVQKERSLFNQVNHCQKLYGAFIEAKNNTDTPIDPSVTSNLLKDYDTCKELSSKFPPKKTIENTIDLHNQLIELEKKLKRAEKRVEDKKELNKDATAHYWLTSNFVSKDAVDSLYCYRIFDDFSTTTKTWNAFDPAIAAAIIKHRDACNVGFKLDKIRSKSNQNLTNSDSDLGKLLSTVEDVLPSVEFLERRIENHNNLAAITKTIRTNSKKYAGIDEEEHVQKVYERIPTNQLKSWN